MEKLTYEGFIELIEKGRTNNIEIDQEDRKLIIETLEKKPILEEEGLIGPQGNSYMFRKMIPKKLVEYLDLNGKRVKAKFYLIEE